MIRQMSLFSQVLGLIKRDQFARHVRDLKAERWSKGFGCWDQFVAMLFCQLAQAKSLREINQGLRCCVGKLRHLGLRQAPKRSTLSYANSKRPWQIYERVFYDLAAECRKISPKHRFRFKNKLFSLDTSVIDLCAKVFDWSHFQQSKGAVKLHLLLDHDGYLPFFLHISKAKMSDLHMARLLELPKSSIVAIDRGYIDYQLFQKWTSQGVYFVTRTKKTTKFEVIESRLLNEAGNIIADETIRLQLRGKDGLCLRRVVLQVEDNQEPLEFLTNHFRLSATTIAAIYKERWQIELFFKTLKQNLKVKTFVGTSANALRIQIWTAMIAMLLLKYLKFKSRQAWAFSNLVALIRWNLFTYRCLWKWIDNPYEAPPEIPGAHQLSLPLPSLDSIST